MPLTAKQERFCNEYLVDFNSTAGAIRAGYSKKTAYSIGWENLRKPEIQQFINARLKELELSAQETTKLIGDIAKSSLNDYFVIKKVEYTPRIEISLKKLIKKLEDEIEFEEEYADRAHLSEEELSQHYQIKIRRQRQIIRYEIELEKHPKATRIIDGKKQWIEVAELDMVKLVADKERGKIKSIEPTKFGTKVELFAADAALVNMAKIHGLFAKDNEQSKPVLPPVMSDSQFEKYLTAINEKASAG